MSRTFQFQYGPDDLQAIRQASGVTLYSPATTLSVWACGLAVALVILASAGEWISLGVLVFVTAIVAFGYVRRLSRQSMQNRESLVRTITLEESRVVETWGESRFEKSWDAFQGHWETDQHFALRHYEKITLIPKRAIDASLLDPCRELIESRSGMQLSGPVASFENWFGSEPTGVYRFNWMDDDFQQLRLERLKRFSSGESHDRAVAADFSWTRAVRTVLLIYLGLFVIDAGLSQMFGRRTEIRWMQLLVIAAAIALPFLVAWIWWKYTTTLNRNRRPRVPRCEVLMRRNERGLLIGYPLAVARYAWADISDFYIGEQFIGFRPAGNMVHVIPLHAFASRDKAIEFLRQSIRYQGEATALQSAKNDAVDDQQEFETGNPWQPPLG